jgi:hypothetical protein
MPGSSHAEQHPDQINEQRPSWREQLLAGLRRSKALRYGSVLLAAALCLVVVVVVPTAMRAVDSPGKHTASQPPLRCPSSSKLVAKAPSMTPLGVNATGASQLAAKTAQFGHMPVIRVYYAGVPTPSEWTTGATGLNKSSVVLSFRPTPAQVLSGADDAGLADFFDSAPRGHVIYYSFYAEPEAHIKDGDFSLAQYKQAWSKVVAIADAAHNPYLHSILILQGQDARPGDEYYFKDYLPGNGIISAIGWDAYPAGTGDDQDPQSVPPAQFMGSDIAAARDVCLPFGFAEFALGTATGRPQWLTQVASYLQSNGALFGILFDAKGFPWMVLHDSASIQTWRNEVARSANAESH